MKLIGGSDRKLVYCSVTV